MVLFTYFLNGFRINSSFKIPNERYKNLNNLNIEICMKDLKYFV